jgi:short-subunit dehydrogenase involved in D-alanine esterification of teichoic acids
MHLALGFLPHLNEKPDGSVIMNVSSVLGYNPMSVVNPLYNGMMAWLHFFSTNIRPQLQQAGRKVRVVEIVPPTVETDLQYELMTIRDPKAIRVAMSVDEFISDAEKWWREDRDSIAAGPAKGAVDRWFDAYGEPYRRAGGGRAIARLPGSTGQDISGRK